MQLSLHDIINRSRRFHVSARASNVNRNFAFNEENSDGIEYEYEYEYESNLIDCAVNVHCKQHIFAPQITGSHWFIEFRDLGLDHDLRSRCSCRVVCRRHTTASKSLAQKWIVSLTPTCTRSTNWKKKGKCWASAGISVSLLAHDTWPRKAPDRWSMMHTFICAGDAEGTRPSRTSSEEESGYGQMGILEYFISNRKPGGYPLALCLLATRWSSWCNVNFRKHGIGKCYISCNPIGCRMQQNDECVVGMAWFGALTVPNPMMELWVHSLYRHFEGKGADHQRIRSITHSTHHPHSHFQVHIASHRIASDLSLTDRPTDTMPAAKPESTIYMVCKAIGAIKKGGHKGVSRASIANYLVQNNGKTAGAHFNATLIRCNFCIAFFLIGT